MCIRDRCTCVCANLFVFVCTPSYTLLILILTFMVFSHIIWILRQFYSSIFFCKLYRLGVFLLRFLCREMVFSSFLQVSVAGPVYSKYVVDVFHPRSALDILTLYRPPEWWSWVDSHTSGRALSRCILFSITFSISSASTPLFSSTLKPFVRNFGVMVLQYPDNSYFL